MAKSKNYHPTGNLYSQSIISQELIPTCSYSSGIFPNYLFIHLQFLSLGGLFSYTGRPFTGTRPLFPQLLSLLLSHCVPCCGCFGARVQSEQNPWKNSTFGRRANGIPGKTALLGAERTESLEKTELLGAERTESLEKKALLGAEGTESLEKQHFWVQNEQNPWGTLVRFSYSGEISEGVI